MTKFTIRVLGLLTIQCTGKSQMLFNQNGSKQIRCIRIILEILQSSGSEYVLIFGILDGRKTCYLPVQILQHYLRVNLATCCSSKTTVPV